MEFIFLFIAIVITLIVIYTIGRLIFTHEQLIKIYKTSILLVSTHFIFGILLTMTIFMLLCAINNTIWHYPYLTR